MFSPEEGQVITELDGVHVVVTIPVRVLSYRERQTVEPWKAMLAGRQLPVAIGEYAECSDT
jgi:hypothetical protein